MQKIAIICAFLIVVMAAIVGLLVIFEMMSFESIVGLLVIFEMMSFESGMSNMLKFGGAIALLGAASALISLMMGSKKGGE
jgi:hypothetical protein